MSGHSVGDVAKEAGVDEGFVDRLVSLGAIPSAEDGTFGPRDVRRVRLLHSWERAGLDPETVMGLVDQGKLSLAFLDTPVIAGPGPSSSTYEELSGEQNVPFTLARRIQEALGFVPPRPDDRARADDERLIELAKLFIEVGASESSILRLFRVYANSVRRVAQAEAELFEAEIEGRLRSAGMTERQLMEFGDSFGERVLPALEDMLLSLYRRHREHVWIEHSTNHAEILLREAGLRPHAPREYVICFVDLTGYTRVTEERGDEAAARLAGELASLVEDVSFRRDGRPIRWLGDGGMFLFRESEAAIFAALEMVERAPDLGLPPTHIGIHRGPVVFQDGDVYGRTVNLASRIASQAHAGQVLVSAEPKSDVRSDEVRFEPLGRFSLKNVAEAVELYEVTRAE
ncbi:MAG: adenylate cyclase regulatory domain-containing protein [Actinomycetota bacterium]